MAGTVPTIGSPGKRCLSSPRDVTLIVLHAMTRVSGDQRRTISAMEAAALSVTSSADFSP